MSGTFQDEYGEKLSRLVEIKKRKDELKKETRMITQEEDELTEVVRTAMDEDLLSKFTFAGHTFFARNDNYPRVLEPDALHEFLRTEGRTDMIKETVNLQTLRSFIRERDEDNLELPDGVELFTKKRIGIR